MFVKKFKDKFNSLPSVGYFLAFSSSESESLALYPEKKTFGLKLRKYQYKK
jgi:hypothetical protein